MLFGAAFFFVPGIGPIAVAGPLVSSIVGALERTAVVGDVSAVGAGLLSMGVPRDYVIKYETLLKADRFIVICHGARGDVAKARSILQYTEATEVNIHDGGGQTSRVILFSKKDK